MAKYFLRERSVTTATLRDDGTVYFAVHRGPISISVGDFMLAVLWLLAGVTLIAAVIWL